MITESALEKTLVADARRMGVMGFTATDCRGGGQHGEREATWSADRSVELKFVAEQETLDRLSAHFLETYASHYAMTLFVADVEVFRPQKF